MSVASGCMVVDDQALQMGIVDVRECFIEVLGKFAHKLFMDWKVKSNEKVFGFYKLYGLRNVCENDKLINDSFGVFRNIDG